jgi:hypothetical protein
MFDGLEKFFEAHDATIRALGVLGTFLAIVVSLGLGLASQRANRTRIKAHAGITIVAHSNLVGKDMPTYLVIDVRNVGILPVAIPFPFFHWKVPFRRTLVLAVPLDSDQGDPWIPQKKYPVEIPARGTATFYVADESMFRTTIRDIVGSNFIDRCRSLFLSAWVVTSDGKTFKVKLDRGVRRQIREMRAQGALSHPSCGR